MKKKAQVVMLPTEKAFDNGFALSVPTRKLFVTERKLHGNKLFEVDNHGKDNHGVIPQHLYFIIDEELTINDWYFRVDPNGSIVSDAPEKANDIILLTQSHKGYRKIVATNNKIVWCDNDNFEYEKVARIGDDFVYAFVREFNGGNPIKEVMLKYEDVGGEEWMGDDYNGEPFWNEVLKLKIRPNGTVSTSPVKDDEVLNVLKQSRLFIYNRLISEELRTGCTQSYAEDMVKRNGLIENIDKAIKQLKNQ